MKNPLFFLLSFIFFQFLTSKLIVNSPQTLINEIPVASEIPYILNNFGKIPYGKSLSGHLVLSNPENSCTAINSFAESTSDIAFLLTMRGNCTYVTKAKYAQLIGVKLLIIISSEMNENDESMNDDGFGSAIHIPSIVINQFYGNLLIKYLESHNDLNNKILLTMKFDVNKIESEKLIYIFWLSSSNRNSYKLVRNFKPFYKKLQMYAKFEIHYLFWTCETCFQNNFSGENIPNNCVSGGRYCCSDPDGEGGANGKDMVREDLRQICLFNESEEKFFDYIDLFDLKCVEFQVLEECSRDIMKEVNLDYEKINKCVNDSFIAKSEVDEIDVKKDDNIILKKEKKISNYFNVHFWPSVTINHMSFQGNLENHAIFETICSFFSNPPNECNNDLNQESAISNSVHFSIFLIIFGIFFLVFVIMIRIYRKIIKKELEQEMNDQIKDMMHQYISIIDKK